MFLAVVAIMAMVCCFVFTDYVKKNAGEAAGANLGTLGVFSAINAVFLIAGTVCATRCSALRSSGSLTDPLASLA